MEKLSFLIVDDSEMDRYILKRNLKKIYPDSEIFEQRDGQEAIQFLQDYENKKKSLGESFPPILTFLDINMPMMNGFRFLDEFKPIKDSNQEYHSCVIMMFTSSQRESDKQKAFSYDFVKEYIVKGDNNIDQIKSKIESVLTLSK